MDYLNRKTITTSNGDKYISVYSCDIKDLEDHIDILTVSAFYNSYAPTPNTMINALYNKKIYVDRLADNPEIDLRNICNTWLSHKITDADLSVSRIGCIEMSPYQANMESWKEKKTDILSSLQAYFSMLNIASLSGIKTETIGIPIIGTGNQRVDLDFIIIPLLNECVGFLKQNAQVKEIKIIERNPEKAFRCANALENSYALQKETIKNINHSLDQNRLAFISYSSADKNIADNLCSKLENSGVKVWYAPRDVQRGALGDYASAIVSAISHCSHFIVILSGNSFRSNHVLNEINLAFQEMSSERKVRLCLLKIDEEEMGPAFRYYLSRQHWLDAHVPPIEKRLDEFVESILCSDVIENW